MKSLVILLLAGVIMNFNCAKEKEPVLGGWVDLDVKSESAVKAYDFLQKELKNRHPVIKLSEVTKAETQVVAGYKVALTCEYKDDSGETKQKLLAHIYVDPQKKYELVKLDLKQ